MIAQPQRIDESKLDPAVALAAMDEGSPREPHRQFALKYGDCFVVTDAHGDIRGVGDGFFLEDTRLLSLYKLAVAGAQPSLLGASLSQDNIVFTANLSNRGLAQESVPHGVVHIERSRFLWHERLYERVSVTNYWNRAIVLPLRFDFAADFRDMFEVRGSTRSRRGNVHEAVTDRQSVSFVYEGLDSVRRQSSISFSEQPFTLTGDHAEFKMEAAPRARKTLYVEIGLSPGVPTRERFRTGAAQARFAMRSKRRSGATLHSSGRVFNDWLTRARADIALLTTDLETGPYPYAGVPWYSTAFGRDGVISALQMLWLEPELARGVLSYLARHQATETAPFSDAEPGKIMHETRKGEMATLKELPFGRYYGGVDTTPLYIVLAAAYAERVGSVDLIGRLWPSLLSAVAWMDAVSDRSRDGFITYQRAALSGLSNQGWKDSQDSVFHADGRVPEGPIALVEVQGYAYAAYKGMAALAERLGQTEFVEPWRNRAEVLREAVEARFWMEDKQCYALALDGHGDQCAVRASNVAHLLFVGLPSPERAELVIKQLLTSSFFTGWGIRTLASDEIPFNPMSYHNGSIWPHDTAMCAAGIARYGARNAVIRLTSGMFEAAVQFQMRLPELFCGFDRLPGEAPIAYPVACLPQAWSAGAPFMVMQSCLGLHVDGWNGEIVVDRPRLPVGIDGLTVRHLAVRGVEVDVHFRRIGDRVACYLDTQHEGLAPLIVRS